MTRRRIKLLRATQRRLIEHSLTETPARTAAERVGVNRRTAMLFHYKLRELIAERITDERPFGGEIGIDESCFGGYRKVKRARGPSGETVVFGILK